MILNGTKGRMEITSKGLGSFGYDLNESRNIKIYNRLGEEIKFSIPQKTSGGHGGADDEIRNRLFCNKNAPDTLHQMADLRADMMSIGIGMAANLSMKEERRVSLGEFYDELRKD